MKPKQLCIELNYTNWYYLNNLSDYTMKSKSTIISYMLKIIKNYKYTKKEIENSKSFNNIATQYIVDSQKVFTVIKTNIHLKKEVKDMLKKQCDLLNLSMKDYINKLIYFSQKNNRFNYILKLSLRKIKESKPKNYYLGQLKTKDYILRKEVKA